MDTFVAYKLVDDGYTEYFLSCKRINQNEPTSCRTIESLVELFDDWARDLYEDGVSLSFEVPAEALQHQCVPLDDLEQRALKAQLEKICAECDS